MLNHLHALLLATVLAAPSSSLAAVADAETANRLIRTQVDTNAAGTGAAVAIIRPEGVSKHFYGASGNAQHPQLDEHVLFEIGSMTKTFTAALRVEMMNRREVRLDSMLQDLLPPAVHLGVQEPRPITLEDLVTHRSGLPKIPMTASFEGSVARNPENPYVGFTDRDLWDYLNGLRCDNVGARSEYSNLGMGVLGQVLARRAPQSFESALRERILQPLQMHETFVTIPHDAEGRLAQPHDANHKPTRCGVWRWLIDRNSA